MITNKKKNINFFLTMTVKLFRHKIAFPGITENDRNRINLPVSMIITVDTRVQPNKSLSNILSSTARRTPRASATFSP